MAHSNQSFIQALKQLNVLVAAALSGFTVLALIQYGLMGTIIDFVESRPELPGMASLAIIAFLLLTGSTRDPRFYHPVEMMLIGFTIVFILAFSFSIEVQNLVLNNYPHGGIAAFSLTLLGGVVIGR